MGAYSQEQGGRFHQGVMDFERCYKGQYNENMMEDYIWGLIRESPYKHKKILKIFIFELDFLLFYIYMLLLIIILELKRLRCSAKIFLIALKL